MRWSHPTVASVCILLFSGCLAGTDGADEADDTGLDVLPSPEGVVPSVLFLNADGLMMPAVPEAEAPEFVSLGWSFGEYVQGVAPPTWVGPRAVEAYAVSAITATVIYESRTPVASPQARDEFTAWVGAAGQTVDHQFEPGMPVFVAGTTQEITFTFVMPPGGLVVPVGERLLLRIADYYGDSEEASAIGVQVGHAMASRVDLEAEPVSLPETTMREALNETKEIRGEGCATYSLPVDPELGTANYDLEVGADVRSLHIRLRGVDFQAGGHDIDLELYAPDGSLAAQAVAPMHEEDLDMYWPNLNATGAGLYKLHVFACLPQVSTIHITATLGILVPEVE